MVAPLAEPISALGVLPMEISEAEDSLSCCSSSDDDNDDSASEGYSDSDDDEDEDEDDASCSSSDWSVTDMEQELKLFLPQKSPGGQQQKQQQKQQPPRWQAQPIQGITANIAPQTPRGWAVNAGTIKMMSSYDSAPARDAQSRAIPGALLARMRHAESTVGLPNLVSPLNEQSFTQMVQQQSTMMVPPTTLTPVSASSTTESSAGTGNDHKDPQEHLISLLRYQGGLPQAKPVSSTMLALFFVEMTEDNIDAYTMDKVMAVRQDNVAALSTMHQEGQNLQCCNRYGESIVHAACRRGAIQSLQYLVGAACVSLRVMDDYHRNPFHDACWTVEPNFELVQIILDHCPDLLLIQDKRGCSPLQYVRRECWAQWCNFLDQQPIHKLLPQSSAVRAALDH